VAKVGGEGIEVEIEAITSEERKAARGQDLTERVDEQMRHVLRAGTQMEHRENLRERVDGQPEPENLVGAA
jgi:hypothetical protein